MLHFSKLYFLFVILFLILFVSCVNYKKGRYVSSNCNNYKSLFIEIPKSASEFEDITVAVYNSLVEYFNLLGYRIVSDPKDGYTLRVVIKNITPVQKFVSPDVVLAHTKIKLELICQLLNFNKKVIASKSFNFSSLASCAGNPIMNREYIYYVIKKELFRSLHKIEHFVRDNYLSNNYGYSKFS
jgi:hypothetical protein